MSFINLLPPNEPAPDKSGRGVDDFQIVENETRSFHYVILPISNSKFK